MPDGMTPESGSPDFKISGVTSFPANESSMRAAENFPQPESKANIPDIRMQLGEDEEKNKGQIDLENIYGQSREEDYAKRDRVLNRLMGAESPKDVAAGLEMVEDYEGVQFGETIDRYTFSAYKKAALEGKRAFEKGSKEISDLTTEGIVDGAIDTDGYLERGGKVRAAGYAIRVERQESEVPQVVQKIVYDVNSATGERSVPRLIEETVTGKRVTEKVYFGKSALERKALAKAHEELHKILVTAEILQNQTALFDETRASLESMVKFFYQKQVYFTNLQTKWFFTAANISKIDYTKPETLNNTELGDQRDKAMRLYYLVGMCEQKENFEKHLNESYNLEEILDYEKSGATTIDRVLDVAESKGVLTTERVMALNDKGEDAKYVEAVKFLLGKDVKVEKDTNGNWKYSLEKWLNADERDPFSNVRRTGADGKEFKKEGKSIADETKAGFRGYLTEFGNPYAEGYRDNLYALMGRMNEIVGSNMAVTEAGRFFWTRGMRDELGAEVYTKRLPTGEELLETYNKLSFEEWEKYCKTIRDCYAINGEPVCSDLSKVFWPKLWRLKEMMLDRSAGPYLTYDKFERLTQSELSLCRIRNEKRELRSVREAWLGYKGKEKDLNEQAKDLGDINWEQASVPEGLKDSVEATEIDKSGISDNADGYFWVMNYLAGDDNPEKRPYQFIMKGVEDFRKLQKPEGYTDKIKFWKIVWHGPAITWGNWRERYQRNKARGINDVDFTEKEANEQAAQMLNKAKMDWWSGITSLPDYPLFMAQQMEYKNSSGSTNTMAVRNFVEKLASKYGFIDQKEKNKAPGYIKRMEII